VASSELHVRHTVRKRQKETQISADKQGRHKLTRSQFHFCPSRFKQKKLAKEAHASMLGSVSDWPILQNKLKEISCHSDYLGFPEEFYSKPCSFPS
jgi:hypothetical protein